MSYFKSPDNKLHDIDPDFAFLLPVGSVPISDEEAQAIIDAMQQHSGPRTCSPLDFIERFTDEEQLAVVTAAMQFPALRLWYDKLMAAQQVVEGAPRLVDGMQALVAAGLLTQQRCDEVLSWS